MSSTQTQTRPEVQPRDATRAPRAWNVVLLDDQHHTYEYVIRMVQQLFGHATEKAFQIAKHVDTQGRAVCLTTHKEHAELKRDQILAFGRDPLMTTSQGSMSAVIEPAEFSGDDDANGEDRRDDEGKNGGGGGAAGR